MKIAVVDVAAETGGALSVLNEFRAAAGRASSHRWLFIVSKPYLSEDENISVQRVPWVKKSWLHRMWFDLVAVQQIIATELPDVILSLQNVGVARVNTWQVVYLHQSLPFSDYRFRFRSNPKMWLYQSIVRQRILSGLKRPQLTVVQSVWMKDAVVAASAAAPQNVIVVRPTVRQSEQGRRFVPDARTPRRFIYPAACLDYKNHLAIVEAVNLLRDSGESDFEVVLTVTDVQLKRVSRGPIPDNLKLIGPISHDKVQEMYLNSVLLFPSRLETVGLPLIEARNVGSIILAADLPYAHEALEGYSNVRYFSPNASSQIAEAMESVLSGEMKYAASLKPVSSERDAWEVLVDLVTDESAYS